MSKIELHQKELDGLLAIRAKSKGLDAAKYNKRIRELREIYRVGAQEAQ